MFKDSKYECPECKRKLKTDDLARGLLWCTNSNCKLFIHRIEGLDLVFINYDERIP